MQIARGARRWNGDVICHERLWIKPAGTAGDVVHGVHTGRDDDLRAAGYDYNSGSHNDNNDGSARPATAARTGHDHDS